MKMLSEAYAGPPEEAGLNATSRCRLVAGHEVDGSDFDVFPGDAAQDRRSLRPRRLRPASRLARLRGRVVLSISGRPETREPLGGFTVQPGKTTYTIGAGSQRAAKLIVTGPRRRRS